MGLTAVGLVSPQVIFTASAFIQSHALQHGFVVLALANSYNVGPLLGARGGTAPCSKGAAAAGSTLGSTLDAALGSASGEEP